MHSDNSDAIFSVSLSGPGGAEKVDLSLVEPTQLFDAVRTTVSLPHF